MTALCWLWSGPLRSVLGRAALGDVYLVEAQAVEERGYGGSGIFAGGVQNAVVESGFLELLLGSGARVGLEVLVCGYQQAGGASINAGVLVVERRGEEL